MATINAQVTVGSDISSSALTINKTMTMKKAGSSAGLEFTTGLAKKAFTNTNQVDLLRAGAGVSADVTADKSAKLYIKNVGTDSSTYFIIGKGNASTGASETAIDSSGTAYYRIGRLYGQDWMLIPWDAATTTGDITIQASTASAAAPMHVEYIVFYE